MNRFIREAGARVLAFLAGAPDYGRGAVLRPVPRPLPPADSGPPLFDPSFPDINPYAFVPLSAASGRGGDGESAAPDDSGHGDAQVRRRPGHGMQASITLSGTSECGAATCGRQLKERRWGAKVQGPHDMLRTCRWQQNGGLQVPVGRRRVVEAFPPGAGVHWHAHAL